MLSVVQVGTSAECIFEHCVVTLKSNGTIPLSVVSLMDAKDLMMPKPGTAPAMSSRVQFNNSFVRGDGDFTNMDACRRLVLSLDTSLVVLSGSLVDLEGRTEEPSADMVGPKVELKNTSMFSREPLFNLSATRAGKGLGCTDVDSRSCLHGALGTHRWSI